MSGSPDSVLVHAVWTLAPAAPLLTDAIVARLAPYVTRWAKTLHVTVWVVGGTGDRLHLLLDAPTDRALQSVTVELQAATTRFAKDTLGVNNLVWHAVSYEGVGAHEKEARIGYIQNVAAHPADETNPPAAPETGDDAVMPEWLRDAIAASKSRV